MATPEPGVAVLRIVLDVGSEPIRGSLVDSDGRSSPFAGWIELVAAIERAHAPAGDGAPG